MSREELEALLYERLMTRLQHRRIRNTEECREELVSIIKQEYDKLSGEIQVPAPKIDISYDPSIGEINVNLTLPISVGVENEEDS